MQELTIEKGSFAIEPDRKCAMITSPKGSPHQCFEDSIVYVMDAQEISFVDLSLPLKDLEFVCFDVETTGLSPIACRLVELSGVKFRPGQAPGGADSWDDVGPDTSGSASAHALETFSSLIDPQCPIPPEVSRVHGITDAMVSGQPTFHEVVKNFFHWAGGAILVAHNANFDVGFLRVALARLNMKMPENPVLDTLALSRRLVADTPNFQLKTLVEHFGIRSNQYHRALADSLHVREILARLLEDNQDIETMEDLFQLSCMISFETGRSEATQTGEILSHLESLKNAISQGAAINLLYNKKSGRPRKLKPLAIMENRGYYYLSAYCEQVCEERTFRVDKITACTVID